MFSRRYFSVVLFVFVLWKTVSTADGKRGDLGESSQISKVLTALKYVNLKYEFWRLCEMKPFMDGGLLQQTEKDKVMCPENPCRKNQRHEKRFREDRDKRMSEDKQKEASHYETSKKLVPDLDKEIHNWKEKAIDCLNLMKSKTSKNNYRKQMADEMMRRKESENKTYLAVAVVLVFLGGVVIFCVRENNDLKKDLKEAIAERERLREELSEREMFHNIQETNYKPF